MTAIPEEGTYGEMSDDDQRPAIPDIFADSMALGAHRFAFTLRLFRSDPNQREPMPGDPVGLVRMSPELARALVVLLQGALKQYEESLASEIVAAEEIPREGAQ